MDETERERVRLMLRVAYEQTDRLLRESTPEQLEELVSGRASLTVVPVRERDGEAR